MYFQIQNQRIRNFVHWNLFLKFSVPVLPVPASAGVAQENSFVMGGLLSPLKLFT